MSREAGLGRAIFPSRRAPHPKVERGLPTQDVRDRGTFESPRKDPLSVTNLCVAPGISLYSYHVRELLVCLAFFSLLFVLLALLILGGIIAWHAGEYVLQRAGTAGRVRRSVALGPAELQLKPIL